MEVKEMLTGRTMVALIKPYMRAIQKGVVFSIEIALDDDSVVVVDTDAESVHVSWSDNGFSCVDLDPCRCVVVVT